MRYSALDVIAALVSAFMILAPLAMGAKSTRMMHAAFTTQMTG